jgi:ATP-binding cassette subfamily B protein
MRSVRTLRQVRTSALKALVCMLAVSGLVILGPLVLGQLIDRGLGQGDFRLLAALSLGYFLIQVLRHGAEFLECILLRRTAQECVRDIRIDLFRQIQAFPLWSSVANGPGERASRLTSDAGVMGESFTTSLVGMMRDSLLLAGVSAALLILNPRFGLISMASALLFGIPAVLIRRKANEISIDSREAIACENRVLEENLAGHQVIQLFGLEGDRGERFSRANQEIVQTSLRALRTQTLFDGSASVVSAFALTLVLGWGGTQVAQGRVSVGVLVAVLQYVPSLLGSVRGISEKWISLLSGLAAARRVLEVLDIPPALRYDARLLPSPPPAKGLEVRGLRFGYQEGIEILKGVTIRILPGEQVALVGRTGAGKTTLARLLARFFDPWEGAVFLGGRDLRELPARELRNRVVFLTQDVSIFRASVLENVRLGDSAFSEQEVKEACQEAGADPFVARLPQGYETVLAEGGCDLSLGERQLLSFARALLREPEIVILDEPTAHVDLRTEAGILDAMSRVLRGRTSILIAHRPSTLRMADRVLRIEEGRIVGESTKAERELSKLVPLSERSE